MRLLRAVARAPIVVAGLIGQAVGRLLQAVVATMIATVSGAAIGAALSYLSSSRDSWIRGGAITGCVLGLLSFASAVTVPVGLVPFLIWCLCGVLFPQLVLAVPVAS